MVEEVSVVSIGIISFSDNPLNPNKLILFFNFYLIEYMFKNERDCQVEVFSEEEK